MRRFGLVALLFVLGCITGPANAAEPCDPWWRVLYPANRCPAGPNDYCPKPLLCAVPVKCFGPDDYCRKPPPCAAPVKCFGGDDYCPKPMPRVPACCVPNNRKLR